MASRYLTDEARLVLAALSTRAAREAAGEEIARLAATCDSARLAPLLRRQRLAIVTIARLRRKLGPPDPIETVVGVGYRLP